MKTALRLLFIAGIPAAFGCRLTGYYLDNPPNPMKGIRRIAVTPVRAPGSADPLKLGEMLAAELVQFPGVDVVHPTELQALARKNDLSITDEKSVRALGRLAGADAVLIAEVTEYNPYHPPRIGLVAQLFFTRSGTADARMAIELSAAGRARPVTNLDQHDLLQVEKVYDGSQRETHDQAASYAKGHYQSDDAIDGAERVLRLPDFYFRFVANRLVRDIFADYETRQSQVSKA